MEEEPSGGSKRKPPSCSRCSNHGKTSPLTHHKCPFEECDCLLCKLTQVRKLIMRIQQQRWRLRKQNEKWEENAEGGEGEESGGKQKQKYCDMCRNHGVFEKNRGHKRSCKYENCPCEFCSFTRKRRQIMQLQQKVKRSNITNQQLQEANEWVTKLTAELANVRIDDVSDISNLGTPMSSLSSSSSNLPTHHGTFPPSSTLEGQYPSSITAGLFQPSLQIETFPTQPPISASSSHMTRQFMPGASSSAVEQHPSTSFHMDPNSCGGGATAGASSFPSTSNVIHVPMASASSYPSFCPPSPSYSSPSASPISDYDPSSYTNCPSPLLSYLCSDNTNREMMTSHLQQTCSAIRNITPSVEPLDCSEHLMHSCRSPKHAENRHHEPTESHSIHPNRSLHSSHQSNAPSWSGEHRNTDEEASPDKYWQGQRRNSDGVIQQCYKQSQRRNSDSVIQGIYRPSQRRNSDSVIKKFLGQTQRGNSGDVIQESYVPEERGNNEEVEQEHYKADLKDSSEDVAEECQGAEEKVRSLHLLDQRRNSDVIPLMTHRQNERRHSDGVLRKCFVLNQRGNYDRIVQKYMPHPPEGSTEAIYSSYRHSERRSSDEISQGSCGIDQRRNSIDSGQSFGSTERRNSDEVSKSYYWPWQRSDSGEIVHENNWPNQRRDSDELIQRNYQLNKEHYFENNLRREHEALERLDRARPMNDMSVNYTSDQRSYYKDHPPMEETYHQATGIVKDTNAATGGGDDVDPQHSMMSWDEHPHEEANRHSETLPEQNYEDMDGPLDLTVRSTTKH